MKIRETMELTGSGMNGAITLVRVREVKDGETPAPDLIVDDTTPVSDWHTEEEE